MNAYKKQLFSALGVAVLIIGGCIVSIAGQAQTRSALLVQPEACSCTPFVEPNTGVTFINCQCGTSQCVTATRGGSANAASPALFCIRP